MKVLNKVLGIGIIIGISMALSGLSAMEQGDNNDEILEEEYLETSQQSVDERPIEVLARDFASVVMATEGQDYGQGYESWVRKISALAVGAGLRRVLDAGLYSSLLHELWNEITSGNSGDDVSIFPGIFAQ